MTDQVIDKVQDLLKVPLDVISQGAEAIVFRTSVHPYTPNPVLKNTDEFVIKYRPSKKYRHPKIDAAITESRTAGEVKFMATLAKLGISAPKVISADYKNGIIWMEFVGEKLASGQVSSLKNYLWGVERTGTPEDCVGEDVRTVCLNIGRLIGQLHVNHMVHGDLTSSNIILEQKTPVLIDFGLSSYSNLPEDKAVDLYVLERAIQSTHSVYAEQYNQWMLEGYKEAWPPKVQKICESVLTRLADVRLRGRKRSMLG